MAAITWKNPTGASLAAPTLANPLKGMFDGLNGVMQDYQNNQETILNKGREANYSAYLGELDKITTPEQMIERKDFLANMRSGFDAQTIDKLRGADVSREDYLLNRSDLAHTRNRLNQERDAESIFSGFSQALSNNDFQVAGEQIDFMPEHVKAKAYTQLNTAKQAKVTADVAAENLAISRDARAYQAKLAPGKFALDSATQEQALKTQEHSVAAQGLYNDHYKQASATEAANRRAFTSALTDNTDGVMGQIVLGQDGLPDPERMTTYQEDQFLKKAKANGYSPASSSKHLDTFSKALDTAGIPADMAIAAKAKLSAALSTKGVVSAEDQREAEGVIASIQAKAARVKAQNIFYVPEKERAQQKSDVLKLVPQLITGDGTMTHTELTTQMTNWMDDGLMMDIPGKDGRMTATKVKVPPKVIENALRGGLVAGSVFFNRTDKNMEKIITNMMTSDAHAEDRLEAEAFKNDKELLAIDEVKRQLRTKSGTGSTADWEERNKTRFNKYSK